MRTLSVKEGNALTYKKRTNPKRKKNKTIKKGKRGGGRPHSPWYYLINKIERRLLAKDVEEDGRVDRPVHKKTAGRACRILFS